MSVRTVRDIRAASRAEKFNLINAAIDYAEQGYKVLPLNGKLIASGLTVADATLKRSTILKWLETDFTGIGLTTGDGFFVMDLAQVDYFESLGDVGHELELIVPPGGRIVDTPSRGRHYYVATSERIDSTDTFIEDARIRGIGGYVAVPPTPGYKFERDVPINTVQATPRILKVLRDAALESVRTKVPRLMTLDIPPVEYLVEGLIPRGSMGLFLGAGGCGKSTVLQSMIIALSRGADWMGRKAIQVPVFYLDRENPDVVARDAMQRLGCTDDSNIYYWGNWVDGGVPDLDQVLNHIPVVSLRPLIIFDGFARFHQGDENSASDIAKTMEHFRRLSSLGATVIFIHHTGSAGKEARGSTDIRYAPDWRFRIEADKYPDHKLKEVTMKCERERHKIDQLVKLIVPESGIGDFRPKTDSDRKPVGMTKPKPWLEQLDNLLKSFGPDGVAKVDFEKAGAGLTGKSEQVVMDWVKSSKGAGTLEQFKVPPDKRAWYRSKVLN